MAEEAAVAPPAAAPATEQPQAASPVETAPEIPRDREQYAEWRQTGKLPDQPKNGDSATPAAKRDSATQQPPKRDSATHADNNGQEDRTEKRWKEVLAERHTFRSERDSLRAELEALKAGKPGAPKDSPPRPADAKPDPSPGQGKQAPIKPKQDDFDDWHKWEEARDKYYEDLAEYKFQQGLEKHLQQQAQEAERKEVNARFEEAKTRYGEEAGPKIIETTHKVFDDQEVPQLVKVAAARSSVVLDVLYVLGSDESARGEFLDLAKKDPIEALRKWFTVEALVKEKLGKNGKAQPQEQNGTPPRGPDGKFLSEKQPAKPRTPAPPTELNSGGQPPGDLRGAAAEKGDFRTFAAEANRRDLAKFRGQ